MKLMRFIFRRQLLATFLAATMFVGTAVSASARPIDRVVVFGDSLSDNGNTSALTGGAFPNPAFYAPGRLSNGPVWVEGFASALGVPLVNRAFAGALTDARNTAGASLPTAPGMQTVVNGYVATNTNTAINANDLFVIWGGANNYFAPASGGAVGNPVGDITNQVNQLIGIGATQFLIVNLPNLGNTPGGAQSGLGAALNTATAQHNAAISSLVAGVDALPNVSAKLFDVQSLFTQIQTNPGAFGFTNITDNYLTSNGGPQGVNPSVTNAGLAAGSPNGFLFFDEIHPTSQAHSILAQRALVTVVPEGSTAGLLGAGCSLLGTGVVLRRRRKA
jgi:phospholipase/lecithinase/hemolysin